MFYESVPDEALRFGDVVRGYVLSASRIDSPGTSPPAMYYVEVYSPRYAVVMSPCCSISGQTLAISPLIEVLPRFFQNPYFADDLTNINRPMRPEKAVSPVVWEGFSPEEKRRRMADGEAYALVERFVYAPHDLLAKYALKGKEVPAETGYYMLDFRRTCRIECKRVTNPKQAPLEPKLLQLSIQTRGELRDKLAWYFGRVPAEDEV